MVEKKSNVDWMLHLVGILATISIGVVAVTASTVKENDDKNIKEHTAIRKEIHEADERIRLELTEQFKELRSEQRSMRKEQREMSTKILVKISEISK